MTGVKPHLELAFEDAIEAHLLANGWEKGVPNLYRRELGLDTSELFAFIGATQAEEWERLITLHGGQQKAQQKVARRVADEITSRGTVDVLRRGVTDLGVHLRLVYFAPAHDLTPELRKLYEANRLTISRQVHQSESNPHDSVDVLLLLNGVPVATAELKAQTAGQNVEHAIAQYRHDRNPADLLFRARALVHLAVDQDTVYMTTRLAGEGTVFLPFNQGSSGPGRDGGKGNPPNPRGYRTAYLWEQVWQRDNWLDLLGSFVHVEHVRDKAGKKTREARIVFPRFHQWQAVRALLAAARAEGAGHNKLVHHSAGSGKSNTIAWLAHRLSRLHTSADPAQLGQEEAKAAGLGPNEPVFHKVIVVTDRVVLDRQLQETVAGYDHTPGSIVKIDKHSEQLRQALEGQQARIIVTTLQKFPVVAQSATDLAGTRFAVIVDEAHSSQSGEAAKDLKTVLSGRTGDEALAAAEQVDADAEAAHKDLEDLLAESVAGRGAQANLSFFAFTATPKAKTLELFGERITAPDGSERMVPFHLYSMRQAIEEGFILDVLANYTTYATYYRLANGLSADDPEVPKGKTASALARFVTLHPTNLSQKAEIIIEHFRRHTAHKIGGKAKAMVVTRSRLHAVRYKQTIDAYVAEKRYTDVKALVAFSGTVEDPDAPGTTYTEPFMNSFPESRLPEKFASDEYHVLVVAEKYQTGFDQPLLHTMYVDKRLDGVKAVQTLSRLNRTHPGKTDTFVLDFANRSEDIRDAFAPFFTQTTSAPTDPNILFNLRGRILAADVIDPAEMHTAVEAILRGGTSAQPVIYANTDPAIERFTTIDDENEQEGFRTALRDYTRAYSFLAQIVPFKDLGLEELFYYAKALLTRLPKAGDDEGAVDLSDAVILTHLRTELTADQADLSLTPGEVEPLITGRGEGRGKQAPPPTERLSTLIDALNQRFGMHLTDADRIWFEQQEQHLREDQDVIAVAMHNDYEQFLVYLEPLLEGKIVDRHEANDVLFRAFFDKPEFRDLMVDWLAKKVYRDVRRDRGQAS
jgi:type I restriction enzyme R subunit